MKTRKFRPLTDRHEKLYGAIDANPGRFSEEAALRSYQVDRNGGIPAFLEIHNNTMPECVRIYTS